ncbi:MAG: hypothetical protein ACRDS9_01170 [Pseudonocardiaceae bacterium]
MTATGRSLRAAALLGPVAAIALLTAACPTSNNAGQANPGAEGSQELASPVIPLGTIVPLTGGSDFPDPARALLRDANRELRTGDFDAAAETARRAGAGADPATRCVADAIQGVAEVNRGNIGTGLQALQDGECAIEVVPDDVRNEMATLIFNTQAAGYVVSGDEDAAEFSLEQALRAAPEGQESAIVAQFCQAVGSFRAIERCASPATTDGPRTPATQAPPSPPVTSPQQTTAPTPTSAIPTTSRSPTPTSAVPTTSRPPVVTTTDDSEPTTSAG